MVEKRRRGLVWIGIAFGLVVFTFACGIVTVLVAGSGAIVALFGMRSYSAPPIDKIAPFIESQPQVVGALGAPVEVSMTVTRSLEREQRRDGTDHVYLMTNVSGSRGEGLLVATADDVGDQGWAGTWEVRSDSHRVLRDGHYVSEGGDVIAHGTFETDGTPTAE